jgi:HKD family nuclease
MKTEIINNLTRENHFDRLVSNFKKSDEIVIVSPFISTDKNFFPFNKLKKLQKLTLVTTLQPKSLDQYNKVPVFKSLYDFCNKYGVELSILIENSLHGKIYISKKDGLSNEAIITSANFTNNGLRLNNEWGTIISDSEKINDLEINILSRVISKPLTEKKVDGFLKILEKNPLPKNTNPIDVDLMAKVPIKKNPLRVNNKINYWLKPIGVTGDAISFNEVFDEIDKDLHFSKLKPVGVKINDILISYAVGHKNILSIYRVKSEIKSTGVENDRWPYYVVGENLTPFYGQEWSQYGIGISNQKTEVLDNNLFDITPSGKNSYGSLMRGADKLKITPEFGQYLIDKIVEIDNEIKTKANNVYN